MTTSSFEIPLPTLRTFVDALYAITTECLIDIHEGGLSVRVIDPGNVVMAIVDVPKEVGGFGGYDVTPQTIGVDIAQLHTFLNHIPALKETDASVRITVINDGNYWQGHGNKLIIRRNGIALGMSLLNPDSFRKRPDILRLDLNTELDLIGAQFANAIRAIAVVSNYAGIQVDGGASILGIADTSKVVVSPFLLNGESPAAMSWFSTDYLKDMVKLMDFTQKITIRMDTDHPIHFDFTRDNVRIQYFMAPRIERDDGEKKFNPPSHWDQVTVEGDR